jgi:hypothetical protein
MAKNLVRIAKAVRSGSKDAALRDIGRNDEPVNDELLRAFKENFTRNSGRDYWYWKDRPTMELGVVETLLGAAGFDVDELMARADDPPDCEALVNGERCGIEATELVHQKALKRSVSGEQELHFIWDKRSLCTELQARIDRKDRGAANAKGGPYQKYILVMHTDELFLDRLSVAGFLEDASFNATFITDAFLGLSYDPSVRECPTFRLRLSRG